MLAPEQRADKWRRARACLDSWEAAGVSAEEGIRTARDGLTWTDLRETLTALDEALKENAALRAGIKRIARKDGVCEACDTLMDEDCKPWCPRAMARALLDPQPTKPCQHVNKRKMGLDSPHRYYCPDCNTYFCWRWARKEKGS